MAQQQAPDPSHLRVTLKPHQEYDRDWVLRREKQHPYGGILADQTGNSQTQTIISLVIKTLAARMAQQGREQPLNSGEMNEDFIRSTCTLVICPATYIKQWAKEVERCCKPGQLNIYLYRGPNRERQPEELAKYDMVFTSYRMVWTDLKSLLTDVNGVEAGNQPALLRVFWDRIILDESQNIKNYMTQTSVLICRLSARARLAVTAYPIQNNTLEMFSLLRFLRFTSYAEYKVWKKSVKNNEKLHKLVKGLILRRAKDSGNPIVSLPEMKKHTHKISLSSEERKVYDQLVQQFRSTAKTVDILQRLMQCCCHLSLLGELPDQESCETDGIELDLQEMGLVESEPGSGQVKPKTTLYEPSFSSTKIKFVIDRLKEIRDEGPADRPMKTIIVSQFTEMLDVFASHLSWAGFEYWSISRAIPPKKRSEAMNDFNNNPRGREVMLVSLKAGRVGLNLIGGNHLFFLDMHWNPALEDTVCDSICREGQTRSVHIHKFVCINTIEERMLELQDKKRQLAKDVLTGSEKKPSQGILKFLFNDPYLPEA